MVNRSNVVVGQTTPPDLSLAQFTAILTAGSSPALVEADPCYQAIKAAGVSIAFATAIFLHESTLGNKGFATANKNPGNTRTSTTGIGIPVTTVKGQFIRYPSWFEGFRDMAWRLVKPGYVYDLEGRKTIEQIITRWAPPEDGNDTEGYINSVVKNMNKWIGGSSMGDLFPTAADLGLPPNMVRIHKAADLGPWRDLSQVKWDIVHDTEGGFAGSEVELTSQDGKIASCHAMIGTDGFVVLMVPLNYTGWTPGNDYYAERSINLELVGFQTTNYTDAQYRSYAAYHRWAVAQGCPIANFYIGRKGLNSGILGHQDVPNPFVTGAYGGASGHTDPGPLFKWNLLTKYIAGDTAVFDPNPKKLDVGPGMLDFAAQHQFKFVTNEQYFGPKEGQSGLGQMSRAWVQDAAGVTFVLMASEEKELAQAGQPAPWKIELLKLI